jgi:hypothetical protein
VSFYIHSPALFHKTSNFFLFLLSPSQRNKAARHIRALAQTIIDAWQSLSQSHQSVTNLTQQPRFSVLRLENEYMHTASARAGSESTRVRQFSEQFLGSVVEVPPLEEFRDHVVRTNPPDDPKTGPEHP